MQPPKSPTLSRAIAKQSDSPILNLTNLIGLSEIITFDKHGGEEDEIYEMKAVIREFYV
jgi:hypothetical protein